MSPARRLLLDAALIAYPADFRKAFREEILSDLEESQMSSLAAALDIAGSGLRMRLGLLANDVSYAARRLSRLPLFVAIVALTFALGIGANVAVFTVLNSVLLKPLPYDDPGRIVAFRYVNTKTSALAADLSVPEVADFRTQSGTLIDVGGVVRDQATLTGAGRPVALNGLDVTPPIFAALGERPELGRFFGSQDEAKGVHSLIISDRIWRSHFGAAADVVGKPIVLDGTAYQIVGIAPAAFSIPIPDEGRLTAPDFIEVQPDVAPPAARGAQYIGTIARLRPSVSVAAANADLKLISARLQRLYPVEASIVYYVRPLEDVVLGDFRIALWTVFGAAIGILIIACANVSNMVLAAASTRDREFALRAALGASTRRLGTQLLAETGLLATIGGIAGVALAYVAIAFLRPALAGFPRAESIALDGWALLYAIAAVAATTILAGFWPMRSIARPDLARELNATGRTDSAASNPTRSALVVIEVSLALALVALSGLMVRSYYLMTQSDVGVRQGGLWISTQISLPQSRYPALRDRVSFQQRWLGEVQALPGVDSAALGLNYPLSNIHFGFDFGIVGRHFAPGSEPIASMNAVSPGYFGTMGIPLMRGRVLDGSDVPASLPVAVVNESFERLYAPHGNAVGMRLITAGVNGTNRATRTVVGVVADTRDSLTRATRMTYYVPLAQTPMDFFATDIRSTRLSRAALTAELARAAALVDPQMAAPQPQSYGDLFAAATAHARSAVSLLLSLAIIAMLLALSGIFGVVSYSVTQRYREFGIRIALGAAARDIVLDVLGRALAVTGLGIAIGLVIAALGARVIASQLYQLSPFDPVTFVCVILLLLTSAIAAAARPAVRATRVDPAIALRCE
jgi:putative ABC transport system permease protein